MSTAAATAAITTLLLAGAVSASAESEGEVALTWREVSVDGDDASYRQQVNLDDGLRLGRMHWNWSAAGAPESGVAPDRVLFALSRLGGDPYESARLEAERAGRWRLRYDHRESEYFRDDIGGDERGFDFERRQDRVQLRIDTSARSTLRIDADRYERKGSGRAPLDISREEFELDAPVDETREVIAAAFDYRWNRAGLTLTERFIRMDASNRLALLEPSEGSSPVGPTRLDSFALTQPVDLDAREHQLAFNARPHDRVRFSVGVLLGEASIDVDAQELADGTDFTGGPLPASIVGVGDVDQDRRLYDAAIDVRVRDDLNLRASWRRTELEQDGDAHFEAVGVTDREHETDRASLGFSWSPDRRLHVDGALRTETRTVDTEQRVDGVPVLQRREETDSDGAHLRIRVRPGGGLEIGALVERDRIDDPYTLISPSDRDRSRLYVAWRRGAFTSRISHEVDARDNEDTQWRIRSRQSSVRAGWEGESVSLTFGATRVEVDRDGNRIVRGGFVTAPFAIDYTADSDLYDLALSWRPTTTLQVGATVRRFDNEGSFATDRDDLRVFVRGSPRERIDWELMWRRVDFEAGGRRAFDADVVELSAGVRF